MDLDKAIRADNIGILASGLTQDKTNFAIFYAKTTSQIELFMHKWLWDQTSIRPNIL
ncbi:MAG: hypothetical protein KGO49_02440 [Gammaproteobacteria bacterium]|nr:hypothetical protein [Gammaproteobacteria bacterium]